VGSVSRRTSVALGGALAVVAVTSSGVFGHRGSILAEDIAKVIAGLGATTVCWWTARRAVGAERAWRVRIAVGTAGWTVGVMISLFYHSVSNPNVVTPALAEVGLLLLPVMALGALVSFECQSPPPGEGRYVRIAFMLETLAVVGTLFALSWSAGLGAVVERGPTSGLGFTVAIEHGVADWVVVVFVIALWLRGRVPFTLRTQFAFLGAGLAATAVSKTVVACLLAGGIHVPTIARAGFLLAPVLIMLAASAPRRTVANSKAAVTGERPQVLLPYALVAVMIAVVATEVVFGVGVDPVVLFVGWVVLISMLVRQVITLVEHQTLLRRVTASQAELRYLAHHDPLTGAANRAYFDSRLSDALLRNHRHGEPMALLLIDVDDFKKVNDDYGHVAGDQLLIALAQRVATCVRDSDVVARIGGDEFAVLLDLSRSRAASVARRIGAALHEPYIVGGNSIVTTASVGLIEIRDTGSELSAQELLSRADAAMYERKRRSRPQMIGHSVGHNTGHDAGHTADCDESVKAPGEPTGVGSPLPPKLDWISSVPPAQTA
jgi:diguanylate cyclase